MRRSPLLFVLVATIGCSSGGPEADDDADDVPDAPRADAGVPEPKPDAALDPDDDGTACATAHGDLGVLTGAAVTGLQQGKMDVFYRLQVAVELDEDAPGVLGVELWQGYGAFADGVKVGDFPLTDDDADPLTCGACVFIALRDGADPGDTTYLLATGGTLRVSSIEGAVSASVEDATFTEFDPQTGVLATTGCARSIDDAALSGPLEQLPVETCDRRCGQEGELPDDGDGCYCDALCIEKGDCCGGSNDYAGVCGDPHAVTSCQGACGYQGPLDGPGDSACYCDPACVEKGDCCGGAAHYDSVCDVAPPADSCSGSCGGQAPAGCFCDYLCILQGDCCPDLFDACF